MEHEHGHSHGHGHHHGHHDSIDAVAVKSSAASQVGMMVTLALFVHKAPEAAGYGTFILHKNCTIQQRIAYVSVSLRET